jgi:hypothetical protein
MNVDLHGVEQAFMPAVKLLKNRLQPLPPVISTGDEGPEGD